MGTIPEYSATVIEVISAAKETKLFRLKLSESSPPFHFTVGQFISIFIEEKVFRAYSIASSSKKLPLIELCVKIIPGGKGSEHLDHLAPGDVITFRGPFGSCVLKDLQKSKIFIAGGTGIAPIKAFVDELKEERFGGEEELLYGVRTPEYAVYTDEFKNLSSDHFRWILCASDMEKNDSEKYPRYPTDVLQKYPPEYFRDKEVYVCGPPPLVKETIHILTEEKNFPKEYIFTEAY
ncbi:FAD-dependent oxidoreductase [Candidatus Peregrinibacteria bacterium]|nr:FAD-dependent oxidoreductase [Candidatus Peregrinibacteria bacterium]